MHPLARRLSDGAVGAFAAAIVLGGAATAVTTDGFGIARSSDDPPGQFDDSDGRVGVTSDTSVGTSTSATVPSSSTVTVPDATIPVGTERPAAAPTGGVVHPVLDAGAVVVVQEGAVLRVVEVRPNAGWRSDGTP